MPDHSFLIHLAHAVVQVIGAAVAWLDQLLDSLRLDSAAMLGHSAGGLWALWYALAQLDRISRLLLIGPAALPNPMPAAVPTYGKSRA